MLGMAEFLVKRKGIFNAFMSEVRICIVKLTFS